MKYIYKTVMVSEFAHSEEGKKYLARGLSIDIHHKAGKMIEALLNHYAKDGWEYWRSETVEAMFLQSISSMMFNIAPDAPPIPIFIFRREFTEELRKQIEEQKNESLKDYSEQFKEGKHEKRVIKNYEVIYFIDGAYGLVYKDNCYIYKELTLLEKNIENIESYGNASDVGVIQKFKL